LYVRHGRTKPLSPYFCALQKRIGAPEIQMELAALVLFSSVALWLAEELHGNSL
jgi:hypothetical protein